MTVTAATPAEAAPVTDAPADAPTPPVPATPVPATPGDDFNDTDTGKLKATLDKVRAERRAAEQETKTLQTRIAELEAKDLTEKEKLEKERDSLREQVTTFETQAQERSARDALTAAARKAGATGPDRVSKLVPLTGLDVEDAAAVTAAVEKVKAEYPELFPTAGPADAGAGKNSAAASDPNAAFRAALLGR